MTAQEYSLRRSPTCLHECADISAHPRFHLVNAAVDQLTGTREFFHVRSGIAGFPQWTEQLASFRKEHIAKHEKNVPGLSSQITSTTVKTISFQDLLDQFQVRSINVLQIDAEGVDALLLSGFFIDRVKPGVVHYEIEHMSGGRT